MRHLSLPQARCWTQLLLLLVCVAAGAMRPAAAATGAVARTVAAQAAQMRELTDASGTRRRASEFDEAPDASAVGGLAATVGPAWFVAGATPVC